jgi:TonB-dependent SusC/RagA subfamily outer membrane receptor
MSIPAGSRLVRCASTAATALLLASMPGCNHGAGPFDGTSARPQAPDRDATVIDRSEILRARASTIQELLEGRLTGVRVRRSGGRVWVEIRGPGTINGSTEALIVVDGIESSGTTLVSMSPSDVERIRVLKDGSAAIYGVRGGNGVLLITTRRR